MSLFDQMHIKTHKIQKMHTFPLRSRIKIAEEDIFVRLSRIATLFHATSTSKAWNLTFLEEIVGFAHLEASLDFVHFHG